MFESGNLLAWMEQALILALVGSLLLRMLGVRHPRTQLAFCHALLAICLLLPFLQPWRHPMIDVSATQDDSVLVASSSDPAVSLRQSPVSVGVTPASAPLPLKAAI